MSWHLEEQDVTGFYTLWPEGKPQWKQRYKAKNTIKPQSYLLAWCCIATTVTSKRGGSPGKKHRGGAPKSVCELPKSGVQPILIIALKKTKTKTKKNLRGPWLAQSVKCPTLDFGSGHDLRVHGIEPCIKLCADNTEPAWESLSLCPSPACALSLSQNK